MELMKLYVLFEKKVKTLSDEETIQLWSNYMSGATRPVFAYGYLKFFR